MPTDYSDHFSDEGFLGVLNRISGLRKLTKMAMRVYHIVDDPDVPAWAKALAVAALGYLICPVDAVPDLIPIVGFGDDAGVLAAAIASLAAYLSDD